MSEHPNSKLGQPLDQGTVDRRYPKIKGRAHWIVCDPMADDDAQVCVPFDCPRQAEAMLNGLQNLRAV